jgi:hypothetical protein
METVSAAPHEDVARLQGDGLALGVDERDRGEDAEGAERDDERRQLDPGHQQPVDGLRGDGDGRSREQGQHARHAVVRDELRHQQRGQHHDRADGQVDAGREDDDGLADGQRADDGRPAGRPATGSATRRSGR